MHQSSNASNDTTSTATEIVESMQMLDDIRRRCFDEISDLRSLNVSHADELRERCEELIVVTSNLHEGLGKLLKSFIEVGRTDQKIMIGL